MSKLLRHLLADRKATGSLRGIYSVCSAHPWVIEAAMRRARRDKMPLLLEATSNQVNQQGGYTGMRPAHFRAMVLRLASANEFPADKLILGGDHLGPNPWQKLPAEEAMRLAETMMAEYAAAGFTKLHLDASMACGGDPVTLPGELVAQRAARMCAAAEKGVGDANSELCYVIGTEVPIPGGATESLDHIQVTSLADAEATLLTHREIFAEAGLTRAWERVSALVVQPGVEFNHDTVVFYDPSKAQDLISLLDEHSQKVIDETIAELENRRTEIVNQMECLSANRHSGGPSKVIQFPSTTLIRVNKSKPGSHVW